MIVRQKQKLKLPQKINCDIFQDVPPSVNSYSPPIIINSYHSGIAQNVKQVQGKNDPTITKVLTQLKQYLKDKFHTWKQSENFQFQLPQSKFDQKRALPIIQYTNLGFQQQQLQVQPLNQQQLSSIKQDGTFNVNSKIYPIPYKWLLSQWIYKGKKKTVESFQKNLGLCFSQIYQIKQRFVNQTFSIWESVKSILKFFTYLFAILFGSKNIRIQYKKDIVFLLELQRHTKIFNKHWPSIQKIFYQYLYVPIYCKKEQRIKLQALRAKKTSDIAILQSRIVTQWSTRKLQLLDKLQQQTSVQQLNKILKFEKEKLRTQIYYQSSIDKNVLQHLIFLKSQISIIYQKQQQKAKNILLSNNRFEKQLTQNFPIRSVCNKWYQKMVQQNSKKINEFHLQNQLMQLKRQLKIPFFDEYIEFLHFYQKKQQQLQKQYESQIPTRIFNLQYKLFPPYKIQYIPSNVNYQYKLTKVQNKQIKTSHYFWKISLYCTRYYTWCRNVIYATYRSITVGPLSLGVLFNCKPFYPVYIINSVTGQLGRAENIKRDPIGYEIIRNCIGIGKIRQQFENSPDNGFCGKVCARICNIFYCYIWVLVIYTILFLMIIKPVLILLNIIFCILLMVTCIIWMPIVLLIVYFFNILIYQYDIPDKYNSQCNQIWFPLISTVLRLLIVDVISLLLNIILLVLHPILALAIFIFAIFRYLLRRFYDFITFIFIRCCARSPVSDTWLAWRISGPNLSRNYFHKIKSGDILILMQAELQKVQLQIFQKKLNQIINSPLVQNQKLINQISKQLKGSSFGNGKFHQGINYYRQKLRKQLSQRRSHFPGSPGSSIRYTKKQLEQEIQNTKNMIMSFLQKRPHLDLFQYFAIKKKNQDQIVINFWERIFGGSGIFDVLQDIDSRFQIVQQRQVDQVTKMMKQLTDEVHLTKKNKVTKKFEYKQIQKKIINNYIEEPQPITLSTVTNMVISQSSKYFMNSKNDMTYSILINLNIEKLIKNIDDQQNNSDI